MISFLLCSVESSRRVLVDMEVRLISFLYFLLFFSVFSIFLPLGLAFFEASSTSSWLKTRHSSWMDSVN